MPKWRFKLRRSKKAPPPVIAKPHFSPTLPNQERRDQIDKSVVWLCLGTADGYDTFVPVINLRVHQGSHCLLFESTQVRQRENRLDEPVTSYSLRFPGELGIVPLSKDAMVEKVFDGYEERIRLTALSFDTEDGTQCPAINVGQKVVEGQKLFFYDLRDGLPFLVEANVNCVGADSFLLDAKWSLNSLLGALAFDETNSLVGVVYHQAASPIAIHIGCLIQLLLEFFPLIENMDDFHHELHRISAALPPLNG